MPAAMSPALPALPQEDLDHARSVVGPRWQGLQGQRIFLTGGTGFVGKWLLATLLDANRHLALGCRVTVLTRDPKAFRAQAPGLADAAEMELLQGDVRSFDPGDHRFDRIIHAATDVAATGRDIDTFDTCVLGTRRVLELARQCRAHSLLLVSSGAVYGRQPPEMPSLKEEFAGTTELVHATSAYTIGKRTAEWLAQAYAKEHGILVKTARCFAFVGPYLPLDKHFAIGNFLRDAMAHQPIVIQGDGTPLRSYLHAADMAAWLWAILLEGRAHAAYNVGGSEAVSILQLAQRVVATLGSSSTVHVLKEAVPGAPAQRYVPDITLARTELQLGEPIGLNDAIRRTASWHMHERRPR
jgi:nucleoside-diphosphate-sugar epimerase